MKNKLINIFLFFCIMTGFILRTYNINWDQGFHLHPDERAIVLYTLPLSLPSSLSQFFSINSPLNSHFFAYGNFPLYLLRFSANIASNFNPLFGQYQSINLIGRLLSAFFDSLTILVIFIITKKIASVKTALIASFIYSIMVLPIQLSHFYAVDTLLTFFITLTLLRLIIFYENPNFKNAFLAGVSIGFSLATKISAIAILSAVVSATTADFMLLFIKNIHKTHIWIFHLTRTIKKLIYESFIIISISAITFIILEPYAIIDFPNFLQQNLQQAQMTQNAFIFPYTLQFVGIIPYFYEIKNIFLWGEGVFLATLSIAGLFIIIGKILKDEENKISQKILIILVFFLSYFFVVGKFAIGFIRYLLPIYPILTIFAAFIVSLIERKIKKINLKIAIGILFSVLSLFWTLTFLNIYFKPNTRVSASYWINKNIKHGSNIAIEHWDDSLPLFGQQNFNMITLPLYDPDNIQKWEDINNSLEKADYIIIASNRLYIPLQKLTNCAILPLFKCYPITANYYKNLFSGKNVLANLNAIETNNLKKIFVKNKQQIRFKKVAIFKNSPKIPFLNIYINDQGADESFTVYDHPKIIIFKKLR